MSFTVTVFGASSLPSGNIFSSSVYVKVSADGPIKTFIGKTDPVKYNQNVTWEKSFTYPGPKGCKIFFEVFSSESLSQKNLIGTGVFDPFKHKFNEPVTITIKTKSENKKTLSPMLSVAVKYASLRPTTSIQTETYTKPFYITIEPSLQWPRGTASFVNDYYFKIPYQTAIIVSLKDGTNTIITADDREACGIYHSGHHPCISNDSFVQSIRVDPAVFNKQAAFFTVLFYTQNYIPLFTYSPEHAKMIIWESEENPGTYKKGDPESCFANHPSLTLIPKSTIPIEIGRAAVMVAVAQGKIQGNGIQISPVHLPNGGNSFPNQNESITPQSPYQIPKSLTKALNINTSQGFPIGLPICTPILLSTIITVKDLKTIECRITNINNHHFHIQYFDYLFHDNRTPTIGNSNEVKIDLSSIPSNITYVTLSLYGNSPLENEHGSSHKGVYDAFSKAFKQHSPSVPKCQLFIVNQIQNFDLPGSKNCNAFSWFILYREPFGNWAILSVRLPLYVPTEGEFGLNYLSKIIQSLVHRTIDTNK